jgi:hypothetical protein
MEEVADYFAYMLGIRLSEINVAEGLALVALRNERDALGVLSRCG